MIRTVERKRERETARRSSYKSQQRHSTRHCMAWVESISGRGGAATAHALQQEHTASENTRHAEAKRREREGQRKRDDTPGHPVIQPPASPVEVNLFPPPTPAGGDQENRWAGGSGPWGGDRQKPVGVEVGTFPTNPGGDRESRWAWWSIVDTSPDSRRRWPGEPVGARVRTFCWGALPLTPGPEFEWLIYPSSK
jgi:hypothetical protein